MKITINTIGHIDPERADELACLAEARPVWADDNDRLAQACTAELGRQRQSCQ